MGWWIALSLSSYRAGILLKVAEGGNRHDSRR